jgi:hypothetical protein
MGSLAAAEVRLLLSPLHFGNGWFSHFTGGSLDMGKGSARFVDGRHSPTPGGR